MRDPATSGIWRDVKGGELEVMGHVENNEVREE